MSDIYNTVREILDILSNANIDSSINDLKETYKDITDISYENVTDIINFLQQFTNNRDFGNLVIHSIELLTSVITTNNIIVTHNGRIRCILSDIMRSISYPINHRLKFKNCCILLLSLSKTKGLLSSSLKLIYPGEVNGKNHHHYESSDIDYDFDHQQTELILRILYIRQEDICGSINFFIVRHGEGFHNTVGLLGKAAGVLSGETHDALLSEDGYNQSINAGRFLNEYILRNNIFINNLFCSDLRRTRQTLGYMLLTITNILTDVKQIIILPCAHELDPKNGGNCDSKQGLFTAPENQMICSTGLDEDGQCDSLCCFVSNDEVSIPVNWKHYLEFYGGHRRGIMSIYETVCHCKNTSMFSMAMCIIENKDINQWIVDRY